MSSEDGKRGLVLPIAVSVVGLVAIGLVEDIPIRHSIEHKLTDHSNAALNAAGVTDAKVSFVGRDGTVRVPTSTDAGQALAIVRKVEGVRVARVIVGLASGPTSPPVIASPTPSVSLTVTPSGSTSGGPTGAPSGTASGPVGSTSGGPTGQPTPSATPSPVLTTPPATAPSGPTATPTTAAPAPSGTASGPPAAPAPSTSPTPTAPPGTTAGTVQTQLSSLGEINFATGSSALTGRDKGIVAKVAAILKANPGVHVQIQGDADSRGPAAFNLTLSRMRAQSVYAALRSLGIAAGRMSVVAYGETHPKVPNDTPAHLAINRRVDFSAAD